MYKKFMKVVLGTTVVLASVVNVFNVQKPEVLSEIAMANVEALAAREEDNGNVGIVYGRWRRDLDSHGCYLKHTCALDGDGYLCSPIGAISISPN